MRPINMTWKSLTLFSVLSLAALYVWGLAQPKSLTAGEERGDDANQKNEPATSKPKDQKELRAQQEKEFNEMLDKAMPKGPTYDTWGEWWTALFKNVRWFSVWCYVIAQSDELFGSHFLLGWTHDPLLMLVWRISVDIFRWSPHHFRFTSLFNIWRVFNIECMLIYPEGFPWHMQRVSGHILTQEVFCRAWPQAEFRVVRHVLQCRNLTRMRISVTPNIARAVLGWAGSGKGQRSEHILKGTDVPGSQLWLVYFTVGKAASNGGVDVWHSIRGQVVRIRPVGRVSSWTSTSLLLRITRASLD